VKEWKLTTWELDTVGMQRYVPGHFNSQCTIIRIAGGWSDNTKNDADTNAVNESEYTNKTLPAHYQRTQTAARPTARKTPQTRR